MQLGSVQAEPDAARQQQVVVSAGERREQRVEGHLLAVHLDRDVQVEPVGLVGVGSTQLHLRCALRRPERGTLAALVHDDVGVPLQLR